MCRVILSSLLVLAVAVSGLPVGAITNGSPDGNQHPNVGAFIVYFGDIDLAVVNCSGSLVAPTIFMTAGHCDPSTFPAEWQTESVGVTFDADANPETATIIPVTSFVVHPNFDTNQWPYTPDIGVIHLAAPASDYYEGITPVELPALGLITDLTSKPRFRQQRMTAVGYGADGVTRGGGPPQPTFPDIRKHAAVWLRAGQQLSDIEDDYVFNTSHPGGPGGGGGGTCSGDSGGALFLGGNASNLQIGIHSGGNVVGPDGVLCRNLSFSFRLDTATAQTFLCAQGVAAACDNAGVTSKVQAKDPKKAATAKKLKQKKAKAAKEKKQKQRKQGKRQKDRGNTPRQQEQRAAAMPR